MNYRLIISDIDGTLLTDDDKILPVTDKTLRDLTKSGVLFATASARTKPNTLDVFSILKDISCANAYTNGTFVETSNGEILTDSPIDKDSIAFLADLCNKQRTSFCCISKEVAYAKRYHPECDKPFSMYNGQYSQITNGLPPGLKVYFMAVFSEDLEPFVNLAAQQLTEIEISPISLSRFGNMKFCFLQKAGVNKETALRSIAEHYNVDLTKTVAIGDGHWNDGSMIKSAGWGIAMQNASPILYEKADGITEKGNNEDGAGKYLREFFSLDSSD